MTHDKSACITREADHYRLEAQQVLPGTPEQLFPFFCAPENLAKITPKEMDFQILTPLPIEMKSGTVIDYRIRVRGVPLKWRTLITDWSPPHRFIDEQKRGPYRMWIHEHIFEPHGVAETLMRDRIQFLARGGLVAPLLHRLLVNRDVKSIFAYRKKVISDALREAGF